MKTYKEFLNESIVDYIFKHKEDNKKNIKFYLYTKNNELISTCELFLNKSNIDNFKSEFLEFTNIDNVEIFSYLDCFETVKKFQNQKFGQILLKNVFEYAKNNQIKNIYLVAIAEYDEDNFLNDSDELTKFYIRHGFSLIEKTEVGDYLFKKI